MSARTIKQECDSCGGTGLCCGFAEPKGTAVICLSCSGKGWREHRYKEFTGRKTRPGVHTIMQSAGRFIATGVGSRGTAMTYDQFEKSVKP